MENGCWLLVLLLDARDVGHNNSNARISIELEHGSALSASVSGLDESRIFSDCNALARVSFRV